MSFKLAHKPSSGGPVRAGVEGFLESSDAEGQRVGLITNQTGVTCGGVPTWKAFLEAGIDLRALFGPEHGFRGEAQDAVHVSDEEFHGVRVHSLYGEHFKPTPEMLEGLDLVVFDIQDVGCRYYTYLQTLGYTMEVCSTVGVSCAVLDRPNPIGGVEVEGGPIAKEHESFVGGFGLAARYGMTIGEFARYVDDNYYPGIDLTVYPVEGWRRETYENALPWVLPSPNLPSVDCAVVYPGTCLFEGTNLSEGRGTTRPFECFGAPWIDGEELRELLAALELPGVVFTSLFFTPTFSKHAGTQCGGVTLHVSDRKRFRPLRTGIALVRAIHERWRDHFEWRADRRREGMFSFDRLAGGPAVRELVERGSPLDEIYQSACTGRDEYMSKRADSLIYG